MASKRQSAQVGGGPEGARLELPRGVGPKPGTKVSLVPHGDEALIALRERPGLSGYLAGSLSTLSLAEVFAQVVSGVRSGTLQLSASSGTRKLHFRDGQLVLATSTEPHEKLGAVLRREHGVPDSKLQSALSGKAPGQKLGQALVAAGAITESALYTAMTALTEEIALNAFEILEGDFLFVEGTEAPEDLLKLQQRTRDLVLVGMKRAEEAGRLRAKYPAELRVRAGASAPPEALAELAAQASTSRTLSELRAGFFGGELKFLQAVEALLGAGAWTEDRPKPTPSAAEGKARAAAAAVTRGPFGRFAELIAEVSRALLENGKDLAALQSFLSEPLPDVELAFKGVVLSATGEIDVRRVLANLGGAENVKAKVRALEALDSFASYAVFSARNVLPPEIAAKLSKKYRELQAGSDT